MSLTLLRTSETSVKAFPDYQSKTYLRTPDGVEHSFNDIATDDFVVVKHHTIKEPTGTYSLKTPSANMKDKITTEQFNNLSSSYLRNLYKEDLEVKDEIELVDFELLTELKFPEIACPEEICEYCINKPVIGKKAMVVDNYSYLKVIFFSEVYDGKTTFQYAKTKQGNIYADRRGKHIPVYPDTVDTLQIPKDKIPYMLKEDLQYFYERITNANEL